MELDEINRNASWRWNILSISIETLVLCINVTKSQQLYAGHIFNQIDKNER